MRTLIKASLNGARSRNEHPAVPITADEIAEDAARVVAAGADVLHMHPRTETGAQTLDAALCAAVIEAVRARCPATPIGLTTIADAARTPDDQIAAIVRWRVLPDFVSVNVMEPTFASMAALLAERGVEIEAGVWTVADAHRLVRSGIAERCVRVLVEPTEKVPADAVRTARTIDDALRSASIMLAQVHHGDGIATWAVIRDAVARGRWIRIGLEDTLVLENGSPARDNAQLVEAARAIADARATG